ncbi:hypothetical protein CC78DRAFT_588474 [Lojkania enalia]|uniref:Uncharacterized protein n=1 Tax=Lojkania enalia TaxID=147567 RepID=A0A9P4JUQ6_9PLEO|nr:hypothetical protein CC78DRAFT_588474 [Didymosphaeria enalia]
MTTGKERRRTRTEINSGAGVRLHRQAGPGRVVRQRSDATGWQRAHWQTPSWRATARDMPGGMLLPDQGRGKSGNVVRALMHRWGDHPPPVTVHRDAAHLQAALEGWMKRLFEGYVLYADLIPRRDTNTAQVLWRRLTRRRVHMSKNTVHTWSMARERRMRSPVWRSRGVAEASVRQSVCLSVSQASQSVSQSGPTFLRCPVSSHYHCLPPGTVYLHRDSAPADCAVVGKSWCAVLVWCQQEEPQSVGTRTPPPPPKTIHLTANSTLCYSHARRNNHCPLAIFTLPASFLPYTRLPPWRCSRPPPRSNPPSRPSAKRLTSRKRPPSCGVLFLTSSAYPRLQTHPRSTSIRIISNPHFCDDPPVRLECLGLPNLPHLQQRNSRFGRHRSPTYSPLSRAQQEA